MLTEAQKDSLYTRTLKEISLLEDELLKLCASELPGYETDEYDIARRAETIRARAVTLIARRNKRIKKAIFEDIAEAFSVGAANDLLG